MKRVALYAIFVFSLWSITPHPAVGQSTTLHVGFNGFYGAAPLYVAQDAGISVSTDSGSRWFSSPAVRYPRRR